MKKITFIGPKPGNMFQPPNWNRVSMMRYRYSSAYEKSFKTSVMSLDSVEAYNDWLNKPIKDVMNDKTSPYSLIYQQAVAMIALRLKEGPVEVHAQMDPGVGMIAARAAADLKTYGGADNLSLITHNPVDPSHTWVRPGFKAKDFDLDRKLVGAPYKYHDNSMNDRLLKDLNNVGKISQDWQQYDKVFSHDTYKRAITKSKTWSSTNPTTEQIEKEMALKMCEKHSSELAIEASDEVIAFSDGYLYRRDNVSDLTLTALELNKQVTLANTDRLQTVLQREAKKTGTALAITPSANRALRMDYFMGYLDAKHLNAYGTYDYKAQYFERDHRVAERNYDNKNITLNDDVDSFTKTYARPEGYRYYHKTHLTQAKVVDYATTDEQGNPIEALYVVGGTNDAANALTDNAKAMLDNAIERNIDILVTDSRGYTHEVQKYLASKEYPNVKVYTLFDEPKYKIENMPWESRRIPMPTDNLSDWVDSKNLPTPEAYAIVSQYMAHDSTESFIRWNPTKNIATGINLQRSTVGNVLRSLAYGNDTMIEDVANHEQLITFDNKDDFREYLVTEVRDLGDRYKNIGEVFDTEDAFVEEQMNITPFKNVYEELNTVAPMLTDEDFQTLSNTKAYSK